MKFDLDPDLFGIAKKADNVRACVAPAITKETPSNFGYRCNDVREDHECVHCHLICAKSTTPEDFLTNRNEVIDAIAEDKKCRFVGVTEGLYPIESLRPFKRLGRGVPMVRHVGHGPTGGPCLMMRVFDRATSVTQFQDRFAAAAPALAGFDLKKHGLCLAGGAASALLMDEVPADDTRATYCHDFDLFLVGHKSDAEAKAAINALRTHLITVAQWKPGCSDVYRTMGCITFRGTGGSKEVLIQVVLRRYTTVAEVIHGFDLGSSAVIYNGEGVWVTALGRLAAEHGVNVLNLDARRGSYESRLARYFDRGFDLALPHLDETALLACRGRLPYLYFDCAYGNDNFGSPVRGFFATEIRATGPGRDNHGAYGGQKAPEPEESDYSVGSIPYGNDRALHARNIRAMSGGKEVFTRSMCAFTELTKEADIFAIEPKVPENIVEQLIRWAFAEPGKVRTKQLLKLLGYQRALLLVGAHLALNGAPPPTADIARLAHGRTAELDALAKIPFEFMRVEEQTALTGPFPRALVSLREWYGDALVAGVAAAE